MGAAGPRGHAAGPPGALSVRLSASVLVCLSVCLSFRLSESVSDRDGLQELPVSDTVGRDAARPSLSDILGDRNDCPSLASVKFLPFLLLFDDLNILKGHG